MIVGQRLQLTSTLTSTVADARAASLSAMLRLVLAVACMATAMGNMRGVRSKQGALEPSSASVTAVVRAPGVTVSTACKGKGADCDHRLVDVNITSLVPSSTEAGLVLTQVTGSVHVTHGSALVATSVDMRSFLHSGTVLQIDGHLPCEVEGAMTDTGFSLSRPYPWATNKAASVAVTNLGRVPGVTAAALPTPGAPRLRFKGPALGVVLPGDSLFVEGRGPVVVSTMSGTEAELLAGFPAKPPLPGGQPGFRVFKVSTTDGGGGTLAEDAESIIDRIARQAGDMFSDGNNHAVSGMVLPGKIAVEFEQALMKPTVDLRPYLEAGSVISVGRRYPFVVASDPALTSAHLHATRAWNGPSHPGLPSRLLDYSVVAGAVTVTHNSPLVSTTTDLRAMLMAADVIMIGEIPSLVIDSSGVTATTFTLTKAFPGPTASNVPIYYSGMTALPGGCTVTKASVRVDTSDDLRHLLTARTIVHFSSAANFRSVVASTASDVFTPARFPLLAPWLGASSTGDTLFRSGKRLLPGGISATANSALLKTTADLRSFLLPGDVIRLDNYPEMVVASGEFGAAPGTSGTPTIGPSSFQITQRWPFPSKARMKLVTTGFRRLPTLVSVAKGSTAATTTTDVSDYIPTGAYVRIAALPRLSVAAQSPTGGLAVTAKGFTLAMPFPGTSVVRVPLFLNTGAMGGAMSRGLGHSADIPLGFVDPVNGSPFMKTYQDLSGMLRTGDHIRVAGRRDLVIAEIPTRTSLRLTLPFPGVTARKVPAFKMLRRVKLSGTVSCTKGDPRAIPTEDLRSELRLGDVVEIQGLQFVVVTPFTDKLMTLSEYYAGASGSGLTVYRVIAGSGPGLLLPGTASVVHGEDVVRTSEDLSASISAGDMLRVGLREVQAKEPINRYGFTVKTPWGGTTARGLRMFNLGKSHREVSLEELAAMKLRCRSIYCLAKVEDQERAIPTMFRRSLNAGQAALKTLVSDAETKVDPDNLGVDATVEEEWQRWYRKAKAKLGVSSVTETHASKGASARVGSLYGKEEDKKDKDKKDERGRKDKTGRKK